MRVRALAAGVLAAALLAAGGCGGSDDEDAGDGPVLEVGTEGGDLRPEDKRAPDDQVAAGLAEIRTYAEEVATAVGSDDERARERRDRIRSIWESILGTVLANDRDAYLTLSDRFGRLGAAVDAGDGAAARAAVDVLVATADRYLAAHPGGSPSPDPEGTPAPAEDEAEPSPLPSAAE